ncbi:preprotein translocase subunit SecE [Dactylosporangium sp. NPDC048998]|uniref:preprotein translocase subunit SecE n=1 Tax=Dactylosporangium sp. NPDC048998 TaxID=3363976 RepID=UPI00371B02B5
MAERRRRGTNPADDRREEELSAEDAAIEEEFADELDSLDTADDVDDAVVEDDLDDAGETASKNGRAKDTKVKDLKTKDGKKTKVKEGSSNNIFVRLINFIREVVAELRKVIWPTRKELSTYTLVVVVFVIIMLAIVGGLDFGFAKLVLWTFGNGNVDQ